MEHTRLLNTLAFIGSYSDPSEAGLYSCQFDSVTGKLSIIDQVSGLLNPTFLDMDQERLKLYTLAEERDSSNQRVGAAVAYQIDASTGKLVFLNKARTVDSSTCHITLDQSRRYLIVSSYQGGVIGLSSIMQDGQIGPIIEAHMRKGSSIHSAQTQSRLHSATLDQTNHFAIVADLGADKIIVYKFNASEGKLISHSEVNVNPGAGPRHFVFHPSISFGYVINELDSTIIVFSFDALKGILTPLQTVSTLPTGFEGENACADIHISPDGSFLYGSNRGHDSIVVYAIDSVEGNLSYVEHVSTMGRHPRNFAISPDGRFLLVANRDTNHIVTFAREAKTGKLQPTGFELEIAKPVCIMFLTMG